MKKLVKKNSQEVIDFKRKLSDIRVLCDKCKFSQFNASVTNIDVSMWNRVCVSLFFRINILHTNATVNDTFSAIAIDDDPVERECDDSAANTIDIQYIHIYML